jgi:tetratricopeptide (TPR) repeat protein
VEAGDTNGYETFRQATVARYLNTTDPIIAGRVCMSSSLVPVGDKLIGQLGRLYDLAERGQNDPAIPATLKDWIFVHLAIVDYRRGEYEKALGWCKQCMSSPRKQWALIANAQAILALSCHQLHRDAEALPHLVQDREFVEREMRRAATFTPRWLLYDFVNTRILLREASSLIESNQNAYSVTNAETQYRVGALYENGEGSVIDAAEAITWYRKAADQGYQPAQLELGRIYQRGEEEAKAPGETAKWFHKVTERANAEEMRRLAWLMAASDDPRLRDGTTAVSFAEKAVAATGRKSPTCLDTLAAAYAEAGQFAEAVSAEKEAIARPTTDDQKKVYAARLKLYELKFAYRGDE